MSLKKLFKRPKGFTLIELIVVIMIIGILSTTLMPRLFGSAARARDTKRITDLRNIMTALEVYYIDNEAYPTTYSGLGDALETGGYMDDFPFDPQNANGYQYVYCVSEDANGIANQDYALTVRMENADSIKDENNRMGTASDNEKATYVIGNDHALVDTASTATTAADCSGADAHGVITQS